MVLKTPHFGAGESGPWGLGLGDAKQWMRVNVQGPGGRQGGEAPAVAAGLLSGAPSDLGERKSHPQRGTLT